MAAGSALLAVVFEGPVWSGLMPSRGLNRDRDRSSYFSGLPKTGLNHHRPVFSGLQWFFAVTRPVLTSYGLNRFVTGLDQSLSVDIDLH
jgi:hypothetical protein